MGRPRTRRRGRALVGAVVGALAVASGAAGCAPAAPAAPVGPSVEVVPATGVEAGDTVTVRGAGWDAGAFVGISGCTQAVLGDPEPPFDGCEALVASAYADGDGAFAVDVVAATPAWEVVHAVSVGPTVAIAVAPVDVADPAGPEVAGRASREVYIAGERIGVRAWAWPLTFADDVVTLTCTSVPASPDDVAAVEAACGPLATAEPTVASAVGRLSASREAEAGGAAVWMGATVEGALVGHIVPVTVVDEWPLPQVTVTPATGLEDGQVVTVSGTGVVPGRAYVAVQCIGEVLDGGITQEEQRTGCMYAWSGVPVVATGDQGFSVTYPVAAEINAGSQPVRCDTRPAGCAVVVARSVYSGGIAGGAPITFAPPG